MHDLNRKNLCDAVHRSTSSLCVSLIIGGFLMKVNNQFPARQKGEKYEADPVTVQVADYVNRTGINRAELSRRTGISEGILRRSLARQERSLRADEFLKICRSLEKDPFSFEEGND